MPETLPTETIEMANAIVPEYSDSTKKADYLHYRIAYFSKREACKLANVWERSVNRWRQEDEHFAYLDGAGLSELREKFANKYLDMQFSRNFHLVMQRDFRILYKDAIGESLSEAEEQWLQKIRAHYTTQSLAAVKQLLSGGTIEQPFDFTKVVLTVKREREEIRVEQE